MNTFFFQFTNNLPNTFNWNFETCQTTKEMGEDEIWEEGEATRKTAPHPASDTMFNSTMLYSQMPVSESVYCLLPGPQRTWDSQSIMGN